jgi:hypothetical protein
MTCDESLYKCGESLLMMICGESLCGESLLWQIVSNSNRVVIYENFQFYGQNSYENEILLSLKGFD